MRNTKTFLEKLFSNNGQVNELERFRPIVLHTFTRVVVIYDKSILEWIAENEEYKYMSDEDIDTDLIIQFGEDYTRSRTRIDHILGQ